LFKYSQLESVQAWIAHPTNTAMPLHARIHRAIRQLILGGALGQGKSLPATRTLAKSLGVSRDTVEAAYIQLHAEGFIKRRVGSGSFVTELTEFQPTLRKSRYSELQRAQAPNLSKRGEATFRGGGIHDAPVPQTFTQGIPEVRNFPRQLWERLGRQALKDTQALQHGSPQGAESLRRAIADYINLERGARATADRILVLNGSQQAIMLCATMLLDAGDKIFIEDPGYHGARRAFDAAELESVPVCVDHQGIVVEKVINNPHRGKAVFLTPSHQFPTGAKLSLDRRLSLIDWAAREQAWIFEDDYDSEFHYSGKPTACVQGLDPHDRTIYIGTFTKSLFPSLRIGYLVLPPQLVRPMTVARTVLDGYAAQIAQLTLARFIEGGHFGAHIRTMRAIYSERLETLANLVEIHLSSFVEARVPIGGLQMPCLLTYDVSERAIFDAAQRVGIKLFGMSALYAGDKGTPGFLLGFAAYTPSEIEIGVKKLANVFHSITSKRVRD